ncbi:hypothetical protein D1007_05127 [Hordeum vulgare]|nr:hypothetical protein D1007_05127 [Hordeum vulgare]
MLKLPIPEIKVIKRKSRSWGTRIRVFGRKEDLKTEDINYGTLNHDYDMGMNNVVHDAIARLSYRHRAELGKYCFGYFERQKADGAHIVLTDVYNMKFSPLILYNQELEQYIKNLQMGLLGALFGKEAPSQDLKDQKLKFANQEK